MSPATETHPPNRKPPRIRLRLPWVILIAIAGVVWAIIFVMGMNKPLPSYQPIRKPPKITYEKTLVGSGIIESRQENIGVMPYREGKVLAVLVTEGQWVKAGTPLYTLDNQEIDAQLQTQQANVAVQQATLNRLKAQPRAEDIPPMKAQVAQAQAVYENAKQVLQRYQNLKDDRSVAANTITQQQQTVVQAKAALDKAQADLQKLLAGPWQPEVAETAAKVTAARAELKRLATIRGLNVVKSPIEGQVLKVNIQPGESVGLRSANANLNDAPVIVGNTKTLQVRVDIDEINANRFTPGRPATAFLKGNSNLRFPIQFQHIQPYMVPKQNLTGANTERVDVRVLQVIYEFTPPNFPVYVGQQVDVHIEEEPATHTANAPTVRTEDLQVKTP